MVFVSTHVSHLSIFSTSSSRDCWNLLLTVGAWYFLVTVLLFRTCPLCWTATSAWTTKRFETIWTQTKALAHEKLHVFFSFKGFCCFYAAVLLPCSCSGWRGPGHPAAPDQSSCHGTCKPIWLTSQIIFTKGKNITWQQDWNLWVKNWIFASYWGQTIYR